MAENIPNIPSPRTETTPFTANPAFPQPSPEVFARWQNDRDPAAGWVIWEAYRGFVWSCASAHAGALRVGREVAGQEDLRQTGAEWVLRFANTFRPDYGTTFLGYAGRIIRGKIAGDHIENNGATSFRSDEAADLLTGINRINAALEAAGEAKITEEEVAALSGVRPYGPAIPKADNAPLSARGIMHAIALYKAGSFEELSHEEQAAATIISSAPADNDPYEQILSKQNLQQLIGAVFAPAANSTQLNEMLAKRKQVLSLMYGLDDGRAQSAQEVARMLGLTKQRISQLHRDAIERIKQFTREMDIHASDYA